MGSPPSTGTRSNPDMWSAGGTGKEPHLGSLEASQHTPLTFSSGCIGLIGIIKWYQELKNLSNLCFIQLLPERSNVKQKRKLSKCYNEPFSCKASLLPTCCGGELENEWSPRNESVYKLLLLLFLRLLRLPPSSLFLPPPPPS